MAKTKEIVLVLGAPASGKSTVAKRYVEKGYDRLNRDIIGGSVDGLIPRLDKLIAAGSKGVVMDNLYMTQKSRKPVLDMAAKYKVPVNVVMMDTSIEDAQLNASLRMIRTHGKLLSPEEMKTSKNPNDVPPAVMFMYRKEWQKPKTAEGFGNVTIQHFEREWDASYKNKALLLDKDGTLTTCLSGAKFPCTADDVSVIQGRGEILKQYRDKGYRLLGVSNQSGVSKGDLSEDTLKDILAKTNELLDVDIEWLYCPHRIPPISCYCRKPMPGCGAVFIEKYKLNPRECLFIGDAKTDETFAERSGFKFVNESLFFSDKYPMMMPEG